MWSKFREDSVFNTLLVVIGFLLLIFVLSKFDPAKPKPKNYPPGFSSAKQLEMYNYHIRLANKATSEVVRKDQLEQAKFVKANGHLFDYNPASPGATDRQRQREEQAAALVEAARIVQERGY